MMTPKIVIHDSTTNQWLHFHNCKKLIVANNSNEVVSKLKLVEDTVTRHGLYAAGFISYEASPSFDPALMVRPKSSFPLLWFGLYNAPEIITLSDTSRETATIPIHYTSSVNQTRYNEVFSRIKEYIAGGETYQVNYTYRMFAPFSNDPWSFFRHIIHSQQTNYAAYIDTGRYVICSASPELFFKLNGEQVITRPMKGTVPRGFTLTDDKANAEWLFNSEKNRAENVMIVDMIRNDLGRIALTGSIKVLSLFEIEQYPTVWQMTSTVTAESNASVSEIITALFPCASVTGAPKSHTTEIIAGLESTPRNIYTGSIGFITPHKKAQFNVAIRTALIDRELKQVEYGVGGGIVCDSSNNEEYRECQVKAYVVTQNPPTDFSLLETMLWTRHERFFLLDYHLRRLNDSAEYFGIPLNGKHVQEELKKLEESLAGISYKVRLLISRDGSIRCESARLEKTEQSRTIQLRLSSTPIDSSNKFLYHKTTNREVYNSAKAVSTDCDDIVLWNERGEITETTIANIVVKLDGEQITPPVTCGLLPGTYRAWLLDNQKVTEKVITRDDLKRCDEIYTVNSVRKKQKAAIKW